MKNSRPEERDYGETMVVYHFLGIRPVFFLGRVSHGHLRFPSPGAGAYQVNGYTVYSTGGFGVHIDWFLNEIESSQKC